MEEITAVVEKTITDMAINLGILILIATIGGLIIKFLLRTIRVPNELAGMIGGFGALFIGYKTFMYLFT